MTETPRNVGPDDAAGDSETHAATLKPPTEPPASRVTVELDTYGAHDEGPDVVVVRIDGEEVTAWCVGSEPEANRADMEAVVRAVEQVGRDAAAADLRAKLRTADDAITAVTRQRDAARAEVERLRAAVDELAEDAADRHWRSRAAAHSYYARILAAMATS